MADTLSTAAGQRRCTLRRTATAGAGAILAVLALIYAAGCDGSPAGPQSSWTGVRITAGVPASDTISTAPLAPVMVEYRDSAGQPLAGARIRFSSSPAGAVFFSTDSATTFAVAPVAVTGPDGKARAWMVLGCFARTAEVTAEAVDAGQADSAAIKILPGSTVRLAAQPEDSALTVGSSYALRPQLMDRCDNGVATTVSYATSSSAVTVAADGTVHGLSLGRASIVAQGGGFTDTAAVSVVPEGEFAFVTWDGRGATFVLDEAQIDGAGFREVTRDEPMPRMAGPSLAWAPDGQTLALSGWNYGAPTTWIRDSNGSVSRLLPDSVDPGAQEPVFSPDGSLVYFVGHAGYGFGIWRAHPDGSGLEQVVGGAAEIASPTLSPDGSRLAYLGAASTHPGDPQPVHVYDLANGTDTELPDTAEVLRWSPDGAEIAFVDGGRVGVMEPDGSARHFVSPAGWHYGTATLGWPIGLTWSQDSRYLIAAAWPQIGEQRLDVLEVATGLAMPLAYTIPGSAMAPAWRP